jgi:predicted membrane GTPase involved in stress response
VVPRRGHDRERTDQRAVSDGGTRPRAGAEAGPGEIVAIAGLPEITIGETIAELDDPRRLPVTTVDEPRLS